jgi:hypothetical protein
MVFGPRDFQFLRLFKLINTGLFPLLRQGKAKFEFVYVKNFVYGIILADKFTFISNYLSFYCFF